MTASSLAPLGSLSSSPFPAGLLRPREDVSTLAQALAVLRGAEGTIRSQEDRIRELEKQIQTDEITGVLNRRGLLAALRRELAVARRSEKYAGLLVLLDLDDFKQINELHGLEVGDKALQTAASVLLNAVRSSDFIARIENDTFAVLLPQIGMKAAGKRLDEIERNLNGKVMHARAHAIPLRASFGFAVIHEAETPETLLLSADKNLYASKARRRMGSR